MTPIPFAPGYEIDRQANVRRDGRPHAPFISGRGHLRLNMKIGGYATTRLLVRVVGETFWPGYMRRMKPTYLDGDPMNCRVDNLRWDGAFCDYPQLVPTDLMGTGIPPVPIDGSDGFLVHAEGYISRKGEPIVPTVCGKGALRASVRMRKGYSDGVTIGREVGRAFDPNYHPDKMLAHRDGNRFNCALSNLLWVPRSHYARGSPGSHRKTARLTEELVLRLRRGELTEQEAAEISGAAPETVYAARRGITWKHI